MKRIIQRLTLGLAALFLFTATLHADQKYFTGIKGQTSLIVSYGLPYEVSPGIFVGISPVQLPVSVSFTVLTKNGREVAHGTSDTNGNFAVSLPPGRYIFIPQPLAITSGFPAGQPPITVAPIEVTVRPKNTSFISTVYFQNGPWSVSALTLNADDNR